MEKATEIFEKHWVKSTGKPLDEITKHHMKYAIEAINEALLLGTVTSGYHNDSFLLGLKDAIEQISDEYDCCKLQFEGEDKKLNTIRMAFSRAISLIEDRMIQHNSKIKMNQFVDEFNNL
jgi:hypothetical protein